MSRAARQFVGQVVVVGYLLAVTGVSLLHEHRSGRTEMSRCDSSDSQGSPGQNQAPLSDDHCPACQFYSAQPRLDPTTQIVCPVETIGTVISAPVRSPVAKSATELLARGPPIIS